MRHFRAHDLRALFSFCLGLCTIGLGLLAAHPGYAQATVQQIFPDYEVRSVRAGDPGTPEEFVVAFDVVNNSIPASTATTAVLRRVGTMSALASETIAALGQGSQLSVTLRFPASALDGVGDDIRLEVTVGIPDIEPDSSSDASNNRASIQVGELRARQRAVFGEGAVSGSGAVQPTPLTSGAPTPASAPSDVLELGGVRISLPLGLTTTSPLLIPAAIIALGVILIVIWLLTVVLRAIFQRTPTFPVWQPPYAQAAYLNPNSPQGRRQLWQQHAQSDTLPFANAGIEYAARKLLIGMNGTKLSGWRVTGLRLVQYDMYGRIQRTNTISASRIVRQLERTARRTSANPKRPLTRKQAERRVRSIARRALREFNRRAKRTPGLPIAVDVRFRGERAQVRILFELYQSLGGAWQILDAWEPEIVLAAGALVENFTYTLFGQRQNEKPRAFRRRLEDELTGLLASMVETPASQLPALPPTRAARRPRGKADPVPTAVAPAQTPSPDTEQIPPVVIAGPVVTLPPDGGSVSPATASMPPITLAPDAESQGDPLLDTAQVRAQTDIPDPQR